MVPNLQKWKISLLWALTKVSSRNQVICLSFAFSGFVRASQHPYDFEIQVVLAQRFFFHYCPGSRSGLFCPLLAAPRCCLLRTIVQMLHPCISFLHKHTDFAVLLWFHVFDAVFWNRPVPVYCRIFWIWLYGPCGLNRAAGDSVVLYARKPPAAVPLAADGVRSFVQSPPQHCEQFPLRRELPPWSRGEGYPFGCRMRALM